MALAVRVRVRLALLSSHEGLANVRRHRLDALNLLTGPPGPLEKEKAEERDNDREGYDNNGRGDRFLDG
ncbi:hypothetical protein BH11ARM2_BH11ARM2_06040 [soil metagenome]